MYCSKYYTCTESWPPPAKLTYQPLTMAYVRKSVSASWDLSPFCLKHVYRRIHCKKIYELNQFEPSIWTRHAPTPAAEQNMYINSADRRKHICAFAPFRGFIGCESAGVKISDPNGMDQDCAWRRIGGWTKPPRLTRTDKCISVVDPNNHI